MPREDISRLSWQAALEESSDRNATDRSRSQAMRVPARTISLEPEPIADWSAVNRGRTSSSLGARRDERGKRDPPSASRIGRIHSRALVARW